MKKAISIFLCLIVFISMLSGCGTVKDENGVEIDKQSRQYISKALNIIIKEWITDYERVSHNIKTDKTFEIINTRIINIKENDIEVFKDVVAVVEFDILSDFYGSAPCYFNIQRNDTVVFYKDGSTKAIDIFKAYRNKNFTCDFSDIIENIIECGGAYNTHKIKVDDATDEDSDLINKATEILKNGWAENYAKNIENELNGDGTLKIINTRLLTVNRNSTHKIFEQYFGDIQAIVEFELYSDYYSSAPYYVNVGINETVLVRTDGTMELTSHYINKVISATYNTDFSQIFSSVKSFGDKYNRTFNVLDNGIKSLDDDFSEAVNNMD